MKKTSHEFLPEEYFVKLFLKWSLQMTKFIKQTRASNKAKTRRKTKVNLLSLEQASEINESSFSKNLKQPTRISPCSILDIFVQWSRHLERKQTKTTNASSKNFSSSKKRKKN
jgi:hypothetical protein